MDAPAVDMLHQIATDSPWLVRGAVGAAGVVVLLWGARIYKAAVYLAAFGAGAIGTVAVLGLLAEQFEALAAPEVVLGGALVGGVLIALAARAAHALALLAVGAVAGVAVAGAVAGVVPSLPWWGVLVGAVVGAVVLPLVFPLLLKVTTPLAGAVLVAWAAGWPMDPLWLGGLWLVGVVFQLGFVRTPEGDGGDP